MYEYIIYERLYSRANSGKLLERSNRKHPDWKHQTLAGSHPAQDRNALQRVIKTTRAALSPIYRASVIAVRGDFCTEPKGY